MIFIFELVHQKQDGYRMVQLGKFVKGKVMRKEAKRQMIRIRAHEQIVEEFENEQKLMRLRRDNLKT